MNKLAILKSLILTGEYDVESKELVENYEKRLGEIAAKEKMLTMEPVKAWMDYLESEIMTCNLLLKNDETLTDRQRDVIFAKKRICGKFREMFGVNEMQSLENEMDQVIKSHVGENKEII